MLGVASVPGEKGGHAHAVGIRATATVNVEGCHRSRAAITPSVEVCHCTEVRDGERDGWRELKGEEGIRERDTRDVTKGGERASSSKRSSTSHVATHGHMGPACQP